MRKLKRAARLKKASTYVLLNILLTGCSADTALYLRNSNSSSMKMEHHTKILNHQTQRLVDPDIKRPSSVNFEYEEIITK